MSDNKRKMEDLIGIIRTLPGWRVAEDRRHWIVYPPKPASMITMARTASDQRAFLNARGDVNRILRSLGQPEILK